MSHEPINTQLKLTSEIQKELLGALSIGAPLQTAALHAGVDVVTVRQWKKKGADALKLPPSERSVNQQKYADFVRLLDKSLAQPKLLAQRTVNTLMAKDLTEATPDEKRLALDASKFFLTHTDAEHYSNRTEVTGPEGGPVNIEATGLDVWEKMKKIWEHEKENADEQG